MGDESTPPTDAPTGPAEAPPEPQPPDTGHPGRGLAVLAFVGIWMALGWAFKLGPNEYLLLGVPLTAAFQLGVRRQPLRALWVRSAPPLRVTPQWLLVTAALAATVGIAAAGALYGPLASASRTRDTALPLLLLPVLAPVLLAATRAFEVALGRSVGGGWPWAGMLGIFAAVYLTLGAVVWGPLLEES